MFNIYCFKDLGTKKFFAPYLSENNELAARNFVTEMQKVLPKFRPEFRCFRVGSIDELTGIVTPCAPVDIGLDLDSPEGSPIV